MKHLLQISMYIRRPIVTAPDPVTNFDVIQLIQYCVTKISITLQNYFFEDVEPQYDYILSYKSIYLKAEQITALVFANKNFKNHFCSHKFS